MLPEEDAFLAVLDMVAGVEEYLTRARGEPGEALSLVTPFMVAGLDSLDMLKVSPAAVAGHRHAAPAPLTSHRHQSSRMSPGRNTAGGGPCGQRCEHGTAVDLRIRLSDRLCPDEVHSRVSGDSSPTVI